ncbi:hypothetical protein BCR33DRAFT_768906 [Rhizoclosmatium globosum]|uniref:Uncharacterized protein n=1 Tax=Rhizoclosmatium globosum TaxID=329046 RepID=A0A1Y2BYQ2_9FUNG|nr:hypothetical protein BCR33DRAFT_768906 [Rhizoclosmatium globosum]|eukprot:ORY39195.1 hypothetical protein BCR33DRAFT_768906 [Rhizoclosmatium globosum]
MKYRFRSRSHYIFDVSSSTSSFLCDACISITHMDECGRRIETLFSCWQLQFCAQPKQQETMTSSIREVEQYLVESLELFEEYSGRRDFADLKEVYNRFKESVKATAREIGARPTWKQQMLHMEERSSRNGVAQRTNQRLATQVSQQTQHPLSHTRRYVQKVRHQTKDVPSVRELRMLEILAVVKSRVEPNEMKRRQDAVFAEMRAELRQSPALVIESSAGR